MTRVLNLSRQIEVLCCQPDHPNPADSILQRQVYLDRLKKCTDRVRLLTGRLEPEQKERIKRLFSADLPETECTASEMDLAKQGAVCRSLFREISATDAESQKAMKSECGRLHQLASDSRRKKEKSAGSTGRL